MKNVQWKGKNVEPVVNSYKSIWKMRFNVISFGSVNLFLVVKVFRQCKINREDVESQYELCN
jgi:hypothetical protein